jgi:tRNA 2-selenouridine synthase
MPLSPEVTDSPWSAPWSEIIDVRSPAEFALDHLPGALNLPVLSDQQRAEVGTMYRQVSPFVARKQGAAFISANIACHLKQHFLDKPKAYYPLIYCWRGGQRSGSLAVVLGQIGWRVTLLAGGYKTYRHLVQTQLSQLAGQFNYRVISGMTGAGKTHLLRWLATQTSQTQQPFQILDLEALALHRGSLLGEVTCPQPSQKMFESQLLLALKSLQPGQPVWVEAESNKIGQLYLPNALWHSLRQAPCLEVGLPTPQRVETLLGEYEHLMLAPDHLKQKLALLKSRYSQATLHTWYQLIDRQAWPEFVTALLQTHYDPAYQRSIGQHFQTAQSYLSLPDLSDASFRASLPHLQTFASQHDGPANIS